MTITYLTGDALDTLRTLPAGAFQACVTSPPYYGLRDYGVDGQIGLEATPNAYIARLVEVFREVRRVLRDDGTLWVNVGDSYAASGNGGGNKNDTNKGSLTVGPKRAPPGYKPKDLLGIPWMLAFALRADGWYLRRDIIWHKPNPMPESVRDRPTSAHEYVFLLSKSARYVYDADAVAETAESFGRQHTSKRQPPKVRALKESGHHGTGGDLSINYERESRNRRSVWTIATEPCAVAHYAVMPNALAELCILAGTKAGDHVLDPFGGAGTTGLVAERLNRHSTLIDLDPRNRARLWGGDTPLLAGAAS